VVVDAGGTAARIPLTLGVSRGTATDFGVKPQLGEVRTRIRPLGA
jgi:hypothetical protein